MNPASKGFKATGIGGTRVEVRLKEAWRSAMVVTPWAGSSLGSVRRI